jgi:hypothetical protein
MKLIFYPLLILVLLLSSCTRDQDPTSDLTSSLTGKYLLAEEYDINGVKFEFAVEWTIYRTGENMISIIHNASERIIGSNPYGYRPNSPFSATIPDIKIEKSGVIEIDRRLNFTFDSKDEASHWLAKGVLNGDIITLSLNQTTLSDNESIPGVVVFKRQK